MSYDLRVLGSKDPYDLAFAQLTDYEVGWLECLRSFAYTSSQEWAKNGVMYVGTTGTTHRDAAITFLTERGKAEAAAILYPERRGA